MGIVDVESPKDERPRRTFWVLPGPPGDPHKAAWLNADRAAPVAFDPNDALVIPRQQFALSRHDPHRFCVAACLRSADLLYAGPRLIERAVMDTGPVGALVAFGAG
jgi:hypothetical protein